MVKYKQGEVYDSGEILEDYMNDSRYNLTLVQRWAARYPYAVYLGKMRAQMGDVAVFTFLYADGRNGITWGFWRFNPALHEDVPVDFSLEKNNKLRKQHEERMRKLMESPEYKFMTKKKDENVPMPKTLKKPEIRKKIFEAIRKGDVEELERLKKEAEKPEPGKRSIAKKFEQAEKEEPEQVVPEPKKVTVEVPAEHVEKLKEIAEKHGWKILLGSLVAVLLMR